MIVCTKCAHHNEDSDEFCGNCGEFLEWAGEKVAAAEPEPEPEPPAAVEPEPPVAVEPPPAPPAPEPPPAPKQPEPKLPEARQPEPQQPAAVLPGKTEPKRPATTAPAAKAEPAIKPGDLVCTSCGAGNDPERKFCRKCGTSLAEAAPPPKKVPWWKKLFSSKPKKVHAAGERPMRDKKGRRR